MNEVREVLKKMSLEECFGPKHLSNEGEIQQTLNIPIISTPLSHLLGSVLVKHKK